MKRFLWFIENVKDCIRWLWRRDSDRAAIMIIIVSDDLNEKDLRQMRDYLDSLISLKKRYP